MTIKDHPTNTNFLSPVGFRFVLSRLPGVEFFCQALNIPDVTLNSFHTPNPFLKFNLYGTELNYSVLTLEFKVDEDMANYLEILRWMEGLGFPKEFKQFADLNANQEGNKGLMSDGSLLITTSSKNPNIEITYLDMFPVGLTNLSFDSRKTDIDYITATVTFAIRSFEINVLASS